MSPATLDAPPKTRPAPARRPPASASEERRTEPADTGAKPTGRVATRVVLLTDDGPVEVPGMTVGWDQFYPWVLSDDCPEKMTFNFLGDYFEAGPLIESRDSHSSPKVEIAYGLRGWAKPGRRALVACDAMRLVHAPVGLSCEPDVVLVTAESEAAGRVSWTPKAGGRGDFVQIEGAADLVCEILSDGNPEKDLHAEPPLLFAAGVREFWRVDCRDGRCEFELMTRGDTDWGRVEPDSDGFAASPVLEAAVRLDRLPPAANGWIDYDLKWRD